MGLRAIRRAASSCRTSWRYAHRSRSRSQSTEKLTSISNPIPAETILAATAVLDEFSPQVPRQTARCASFPRQPELVAHDSKLHFGSLNHGPATDLNMAADVRSWGQLGRDMLRLSSSQIDPGCVKTRALEEEGE